MADTSVIRRAEFGGRDELPDRVCRPSFVFALAACLTTLSCGQAATPEATTPRASDPAARPERAAAFSADDRHFKKFHSKRFQLTVPFPDGSGWKVDDHSKAELVALHAATSSRVRIQGTHEQELMNRQRCEERAKSLGWLPSASLTTVEDEVTVGPEAYDSRVWVAIDAGRPGGSVEGHVYLFGAFIRQCLLVHVTTSVPTAKDEEILAARLALVRGRIVKGIVLDPPRTTDDAAVPKEKPDSRR